ncbi:MAG: T9SS type A sorting domain-containing protein [Vicingus serpentipes]|nr:T9SS type A sorting domain-containing protein [Vicingus serpentipes]
MKRKLLLIATLFSVGCISAQVVDTVSTGIGYANENYYTLDNGNEVPIIRSDWDLAFASDGLGGSSSTIRINGGMGTECWVYSNDTTQWSTLDTTAFAWTTNQLVNADTSWTVGAFENKVPVNGFDLGWGTYNMITHAVNGDRIFILKLANGDYKKLVITSLISGVFSFRYANLDGSGYMNTTITKSNYSGKNFGYYSIQNNQTVDREPLSASWDLLFTKYITDLGGGTYYAVTGVLANKGVSVAQANNVPDVNNISYLSQVYDSSKINVIGYDWKSFNMSTFQYDIEDSLVYFASVPNGDVYKIIFTGFGGSSTGDYIFTKEKVFSVGIDEDEIESKILNVYPNPATDNINITFAGTTDNTQISIYDISGKEMFTRQVQNKGLNKEKIDVSNFKQGIYFITLTTANSKSTQKIIIK